MIFILGDTFENVVCEMVAILPRLNVQRSGDSTVLH